MLLLNSSIRIPSLILATLFFVACGESKVADDTYNSKTYAPPSHLSFDPELQPIMDSYLADAAAAGVPVPETTLQEFQGLMWTDKVNVKASADATILGVCHRRSGLRYVEILHPTAEGKVGSTVLDDITLKVMVYHELGHCLHDFSGHTSGKGAAVMNAYLQPARYFDPEALLMDHFQMLKKMRDNPSFRP
jgi:hypothetical protein